MKNRGIPSQISLVGNSLSSESFDKLAEYLEKDHKTLNFNLGMKGANMVEKSTRGFSDEEREAMKERAQELAAGEVKGESAVLMKIAEMPEPDQTMAKRIHKIIKASVPALSPRTWYGMPAYADKDGKVICFFQSAHRFKSRYATFGFNDAARLDEGNMWPISFALRELTPAEEVKIAALVKKAVN
jgi:uncharacterized protein YdhG (YjbR/CyaY superfamily)